LNRTKTARRTRARPAETFGARLAELRKAAGLTQVELAEAIGTSQRMVAYYERTEDYPLARLLRNLSRALGATADELLGLTPQTPRLAIKRARKRRATRA
jgi:transcriptional regulator with XRE-family HTH domain